MPVVDTVAMSELDYLAQILARLEGIEALATGLYHWFVTAVLLAVAAVVAYFVCRPLLYFLQR